MSHERQSVRLAAACSCVLAMSAMNAAAQDKPPAGGRRESKADTATLEEVVITGSFIRGTPEDSSVPVEVISFEELQNLGRPSNLDLIKSMSEVGGVAGESNRGNSFPVGAATVNLRSLGPRFTTVVFNGRRFPEQFASGVGRFNNVSWIPNAAVGSVETLKAGGAATYGADAVAGVVNYITRKNVDGLELNADYRYIADSDGDYTADLVWGKQLTGGNVMVVAGYQHRSELRSVDRPWSQREYLENPASWSANSSPGAYVFQRPAGATNAQTSITPIGSAANGVSYTGNRQMGSTGVVRDPGCAALGGFAAWSTTPSPVCRVNTALFENLVAESDTYQLYTEYNKTLGSSLELHVEGLYFNQKFPNIAIASAQGSDVTSWPVAPPTTPGGLPAFQAVAGSAAFFVPGQNPAVGAFLNSFQNQDGTTAYTPAQIAAITSGGRAALLFGAWGPFGLGGSPLFGRHSSQENSTQIARVTTALSGSLPEFLGTSLEWELGFTFNKVTDRKEAQDVQVNRFQAALNGLGGAGCTGNTPGANGCQFFNPFGSAIERNMFTGEINPGFIGTGSYAGYAPGQGLRNDAGLLDWLYEPVWLERTYYNYVFDPIIRGDTGVKLPGGNILVAVGGQYRLQTEDTDLNDLSNRNLNPCPTPGIEEAGCTEAARVGPYMFTRPASVLGGARDDHRRFPVAAGFVEAQLPVLESLTFQVAGRYEKFYSDVTDKDNDIFVPAVSLKWEPLRWLGVRASWGETFSQVNPPRDRPPTTATSFANTTFGNFGGTGESYTTNNYGNQDVESEKGSFIDLGLLFSAGNFTANVDYYDIRVDDYTRTMSVTNVLSALVQPGEVRAPTSLINCSSALFTAQPGLDGRAFIELNGPCVQGSSRLNSAAGGGGLVGGTVNYFGGLNQTNSGELVTEGIDLSASYRFDNVLGGSLTPSLDYSRILKWELSDFVVAGVTVAEGYDGLGFLNQAAGRIANSVAKFRASFGVLYRNGRHTVNVLTRYVPSIINDDTTDFTANSTRNANIGDVNGITTNGNACAVATPDPLTSNLGQVPAGAGSGEFATGTTTGGSRGFCTGQNTLIQSGRTVESYFNVDLVYRLQLPSETSMTLTVYNVLNDEPSFQRQSIGYNSAYGSPLERNVKLGFTKKF